MGAYAYSCCIWHTNTGSPAIDIPRPNRQSRPPLFVPTQSSSPNWSIVPLPPSPNFEWLPRIDTHPSVASPGLFTNPQTSNSPSAEGPYGAALIQRPNPTQPRQIAPPQSPSSSAQSHNTIYTPRRSPMDRLHGTLFKTTLVSTLPNQSSTTLRRTQQQCCLTSTVLNHPPLTGHLHIPTQWDT